MGIDPATCDSFDIMTIDIHTVEDGKIATTYHIEEWATGCNNSERNNAHCFALNSC
jgi:hypothetical protein